MEFHGIDIDVIRCSFECNIRQCGPICLKDNFLEGVFKTFFYYPLISKWFAGIIELK